MLLPSHSKGLQPRVPPCLLWLNLYPLYTDVYGVCVSVHTSKSTSLTTLKCSQASFWLSRVVSNDRWFGSHVFQRSAFDLGRRKGDGRELLMQGNHPEIQSRRFVKRFIDHTKQTSSMHSIWPEGCGCCVNELRYFQTRCQGHESFIGHWHSSVKMFKLKNTWNSVCVCCNMKTDMAHRLHSTQRLIGTRKCAQGYPANHVIRYDLVSGGPSVNSYFRCHGGPNLCCRSGAVSFSSLHFQQLMRWRAPKCWILGPRKEIRDGQSFIWKFWWNCQGSIVSIASNSSPGLRDWQTLSMLHVEKCSVQVLLRLAVPSDQAAARPFFELLFFNFDSWSLVRLQAEQLAIGLYETHFGESLDTNSMSAWRWNCDWSYLFIFVISNHSDFLSIIDIKFLSLTIQSSDWQV